MTGSFIMPVLLQNPSTIEDGYVLAGPNWNPNYLTISRTGGGGLFTASQLHLHAQLTLQIS
jgi:hypothetical protein